MPDRARYPRSARVNELLREIIAEALRELADERLEQVAVTSVSVDPPLRHAIVYFDSLTGEDADEVVLAALAEVRWKLQAAIGRQARLKRTPELVFRPDDVERRAERLETILRQLNPDD